jgi:hypothetical protein
MAHLYTTGFNGDVISTITKGFIDIEARILRAGVRA